MRLEAIIAFPTTVNAELRDTEVGHLRVITTFPYSLDKSQVYIDIMLGM